MVEVGHGRELNVYTLRVHGREVKREVEKKNVKWSREVTVKWMDRVHGHFTFSFHVFGPDWLKKELNELQKLKKRTKWALKIEKKELNELQKAKRTKWAPKLLHVLHFTFHGVFKF